MRSKCNPSLSDRWVHPMRAVRRRFPGDRCCCCCCGGAEDIWRAIAVSIPRVHDGSPTRYDRPARPVALPPAAAAAAMRAAGDEWRHRWRHAVLLTSCQTYSCISASAVTSACQTTRNQRSTDEGMFVKTDHCNRIVALRWSEPLFFTLRAHWGNPLNACSHYHVLSLGCNAAWIAWW